MSSQCLHQSSDASIALDRTRPATCTSDSAIELDEGSGSRKRKRDAGTVNELLRDSFVVKVDNHVVGSLECQSTDTYSSHIPPKPRAKSDRCSLYSSSHVPSSHCRIWIFWHHQTHYPHRDCLRAMSKYSNLKVEWGLSRWS
jgi:hypothetical protein